MKKCMVLIAILMTCVSVKAEEMDFERLSRATAIVMVNASIDLLYESERKACYYLGRLNAIHGYDGYGYYQQPEEVRAFCSDDEDVTTNEVAEALRIERERMNELF